MKPGIPYRSADVSHVPPPDPAAFWPFEEGQTRTIGVATEPGQALAFRVNRIHDTWIEGTETLGSTIVSGELHLDAPVVIVRDPSSGEPQVTLTLRRVADGKAFLQVTAHPGIRRGWIQ